MFENYNFKRFGIEKLSKCCKCNGSNQKSVVPKFQVQIKYCKIQVPKYFNNFKVKK